MSDRNPPPSQYQLLVLLGIFVAIVVIIIGSISFLVDWAITKIPVSWEQKLGSVIAPIYEQQAKSSPEQDNLNKLLDRLESQLDNQSSVKRDYHVIYIPESTVNAFAIPGDVIGIFEGLLQEVQSENELMMILGHELGHFAHRDHLRGLGKTLAIQVAIASIFGNTGILNNSAGTIIQTISNTHYSQSQEYQADEFGLMLLNKTYGHVAGATDFFQNLQQKEKLGWDFFSTHPASEKRVKKLKKMIQQKQYSIGEYSPLNPILKGGNQ